MHSLEDVTVGVKTFLRPELLVYAVGGIQTTLYGSRIIVADDGKVDWTDQDFYDELIRSGPHKVITLPFDSGFGMKSNAIADALETKYLLVGSDDFDFAPMSVRHGVEKLVRVLDSYPDFAVASGRVNNRPYEFNLQDNGDVIIEHPVDVDKSSYWEDVRCQALCMKVDLTVNYSLIRREVFEKVRWDDDVKIGGGEHGAFFVDVKRAGFNVMWVRDVNIDEQRHLRNPEYMRYRNRARGPERPCFVRRGIKKYVLGTGQVDYECVS